MVEYTDDLALIVRYDGTKADFDAVKSNYLGKVVFIYGSKTEVANQAGLVQAIWVSDANGGRYLDMANVEYISNNLTHISGITVDGKTYYPSSGGGAITLAGANGIAVTVNTTTGAVTFDGKDLKASLIGTTSNGSNTTTHPDTIRGAKAYADTLYAELKGTKDAEDTTAQTIEGAKDYADKVKADLEGTKAEGDTTAQTIEGAKKYTDALRGDGNDGIEDNTVLGVKNYVTQLPAALDISIKVSEGTGDISKVYTFYQGEESDANKIGTINIPKDLVVTSGSVVEGQWLDGVFTPYPNGPGKAIKLVIANQQDPIYINVADLVDAYTAQQNATEVQIAISDTNEISATINSVSGAKITDESIEKGKLAVEVQASLDNAVTDVGAQPSDTDYLTFNVAKSGTVRTISYDVKTDNTIGDAIVDTTKKGLATVEDVAAYLKARLSVKVVS